MKWLRKFSLNWAASSDDRPCSLIITRILKWEVSYRQEIEFKFKDEEFDHDFT